MVELSKEALQLALGHAVAELGAARAEATQPPLAQPPTDGLWRRAEALGYFANGE